MSIETTDVVVIGTGFGGAIPAYNLAAGGAKVVMLERGPEVATEEFAHDLRIGTYTRYVDLINGDGIQVVAGNCVGGSSVVYFAASLRAPSFVFDRRGSAGAGRLRPRGIDQSSEPLRNVRPVGSTSAARMPCVPTSSPSNSGSLPIAMPPHSAAPSLLPRPPPRAAAGAIGPGSLGAPPGL